MKRQETQKERIMPPVRAQRLNLERVKQLAAEQKAGLALLAKNDGPVAESKRITHR